jgi:hypothetical protein
MKHVLALILAILSSGAHATLPVPIELMKQNYPANSASQIQFNVVSPTEGWTRFIINWGAGPRYYCFKFDPTAGLLQTNGWIPVTSLWANQQAVAVPMSVTDQEFCWK